MIVYCLRKQEFWLDKDGKEYRAVDGMIVLEEKITEEQLEEKFPNYVQFLSLTPERAPRKPSKTTSKAKGVSDGS